MRAPGRARAAVLVVTAAVCGIVLQGRFPRVLLLLPPALWAALRLRLHRAAASDLEAALDRRTRELRESEERAREVLADALERHRRLELRVEEQMAELARAGELRRFLPHPVGDRLMAGELGTRQPLTRRRVTVVVAGVAGFSELAERLEPEDFSELVNDYLAAVTAAAVRHGGMLDHLATGGMMILFGAPDAAEVEDQAWSAAQAALAMRDCLAGVGTACLRRGVGVELLLSAGIDTGHATVGFFGSDLLRTYTAMGSVVLVAGHLRGRAAPGQILCSASTRAALAGRVGTRRCEPLARAGMRPVEVFELVGSTPSDGPVRGALDLSAAVVPWSPTTAAAPSRVFRREGAYWTIAYDGSLFRLPDSKGLGHLARLLAHRGSELHVLQLVDLDRDGVRARPAAAVNGNGLRVAGNGDGDAGEILDGQARTAYRHRLGELREELEEAEVFHDLGRQARAQAEMDALTEQLASAIGLSGRSRRAHSDAERARVNITKRIRAAISAIGRHDPALEAHLRAAVRTGIFCSYVPDPALDIVWSL
ncbi:MAG TPA: adenylate/guanylate cyclase domain-containing protein [Candidatus Dormibacteraeota bacterium]